MFRAAGSAGLNNVCDTEGILQLAEGLRFFCPFLGNPWLDPLSRRKLHAVWRQHFLHRGALRRQAADLRRRNGPAAARQAAMPEQNGRAQGREREGQEVWGSEVASR